MDDLEVRNLIYRHLADTGRAPTRTQLAGQLGDDVDAAEHPDGSVTFTVPVTSWPAFRGFVLSFLDRAELVGPADLRADLVEWVAGLVGEEK